MSGRPRRNGQDGSTVAVQALETRRVEEFHGRGTIGTNDIGADAAAPILNVDDIDTLVAEPAIIAAELALMAST